MKIIFLDIDGVLNCRETHQRIDASGDPLGQGHRGGIIGIDPVLVARFNRIVERTGAQIVLSSTWRMADDWRETMRRAGLPEMLDRTPHLMSDEMLDGTRHHYERGEEIEEWLLLHLRAGNDVEKYVILDDDADFFPSQPHVQTNFMEGGLTEAHAERVVAMLGISPA